MLVIARWFGQRHLYQSVSHSTVVRQAQTKANADKEERSVLQLFGPGEEQAG